MALFAMEKASLCFNMSFFLFLKTLKDDMDLNRVRNFHLQT